MVAILVQIKNKVWGYKSKLTTVLAVTFKASNFHTILKGLSFRQCVEKQETLLPATSQSRVCAVA